MLNKCAGGGDVLPKLVGALLDEPDVAMRVGCD